MSTEPKWLTKRMVLTLHGESIRRFGGLDGIRDDGLLESALDRPRIVFAYEEDVSVIRLAAVLCSGIVRNHPFVDGNKRTGLLALRAFLFLNEYLFEPSESEEVLFILSLAAGELEEAELVAWIEANTKPR